MERWQRRAVMMAIQLSHPGLAERLVQLRGFNGFSYADVAGELKITTASLHYHFPGQADLGRALIVRYASRFTDALAEIDARRR